MQFYSFVRSCIWQGKTVIVFSLPGAFTPTCSTSHLPRYEELAPVFFSKGVDAIYCVSVNDTFVMDSWGRAQGAKYIYMKLFFFFFFFGLFFTM